MWSKDFAYNVYAITKPSQVIELFISECFYQNLNQFCFLRKGKKVVVYWSKEWLTLIGLLNILLGKCAKLHLHGHLMRTYSLQKDYTYIKWNLYLGARVNSYGMTRINCQLFLNNFKRKCLTCTIITSIKNLEIQEDFVIID
jgi:hypothetical protein